jgi:hypothetical protein
MGLSTRTAAAGLAAIGALGLAGRTDVVSPGSLSARFPLATPATRRVTPPR